MATADLHFHTIHSDGKHSVSWIIEQLGKARADGLGLGVLTDHDGVAGYEEFAEGVKNYWKPICASELSCTFLSPEGRHKELHLLVYGIDPNDSYMKGQFAKFKEERRKRFLAICDRFKEAGYPIDGESLAKKTKGVLGRPHIADALVERGVVKDRQEAFERFLYDGHPYHVPKWRFPLEDAVQYAKKAGLKTSVAHPGQYQFTEGLLKTWKDLGVDAIEVFHPRHTPSDTQRYMEIANRLGFRISGGSDFHTDETDLFGNRPSVGYTRYPLEAARKFLGALL